MRLKLSRQTQKTFADSVVEELHKLHIAFFASLDDFERLRPLYMQACAYDDKMLEHIDDLDLELAKLDSELNKNEERFRSCLETRLAFHADQRLDVQVPEDVFFQAHEHTRSSLVGTLNTVMRDAMRIKECQDDGLDPNAGLKPDSGLGPDARQKGDTGTKWTPERDTARDPDTGRDEANGRVTMDDTLCDRPRPIFYYHWWSRRVSRPAKPFINPRSLSALPLRKLCAISFLPIAAARPTRVPDPSAAESGISYAGSLILSLAPLGILLVGTGNVYRHLRGPKRRFQEPAATGVLAAVAAQVWCALQATIDGTNDAKSIAIAVWFALLANYIVGNRDGVKNKSQYVTGFILGGGLCTLILDALFVLPRGGSLRELVQAGINTGPLLLTAWSWILLVVQRHVERHEDGEGAHQLNTVA